MKIFGIEYQGVTSRKCKMHVFDEKTKKVPSKIWISDDFVLSLYPNFGMEVFGVWQSDAQNFREFCVCVGEQVRVGMEQVARQVAACWCVCCLLVIPLLIVVADTYYTLEINEQLYIWNGDWFYMEICGAPL